MTTVAGGSGERRPIGEGCGDAVVPFIDAMQARGIVSIHEACEPPCPRKGTALEFLRRADDESPQLSKKSMLPQRTPKCPRPEPVPRVPPAVLMRVAEAIQQWRRRDVGDRSSEDRSSEWRDES